MKTRLLSLLTIFSGVLILSLLHIHNGFPLLMADSIGYLKRAITLMETSHWSNTYGVFLISIIKTFGSVQWIPFFQNLIIVTVLYHFCKIYIPNFKNWIFLLILNVLLLTTLPWVSTMLMSDIFTPISILSIILILDGKLTKQNYWILIPIVFISISAHQSHILILPIFSISFLTAKYFSNQNIKFISVLKYLFLISILIVSSNIFEKNILNNREKSITTVENLSNPDISSGYYFVAVRIAESGELKYMLNEFCSGTQGNYLCKETHVYDASRIKNQNALRRNSNDQTYVDYSIDIKEFVLFAITKPRFYLGMCRIVVKRGFETLRNTKLRTYKRPNGLQMKRFDTIFDKINHNDLISFNSSKQSKNIYYNLISEFYEKIDKIWWRFVLPLTIFAFLILSIKKKSAIVIQNKLILLFLILAHIINTLICGTFSNYANLRYSNRTFWLVNLVLILILIQVIQHFTLKNRLEKA